MFSIGTATVHTLTLVFFFSFLSCFSFISSSGKIILWLVAVKVTIMGIEGNHAYSKTGNMDKLSTPPGFVSQTTFVLRNVHQDRESSRPGQVQEQITGFGMDDASFKLSLSSRPWIVHDDHTKPTSETLKPTKPEVPITISHSSLSFI